MPGQWSFENRNDRAVTRCVMCETVIRSRLPAELRSFYTTHHGQQWGDRLYGFVCGECKERLGNGDEVA